MKDFKKAVFSQNDFTLLPPQAGGKCHIADFLSGDAGPEDRPLPHAPADHP